MDPSPQLVEHVRERLRGVDVRVAKAEELPYSAESFDAVLAQLVLYFMTDPVKGLREMKRVARRGVVVAACVCDFKRDKTPLTMLWDAARQLTRRSKPPDANGADLGDTFEDAGSPTSRSQPLISTWPIPTPRTGGIRSRSESDPGLMSRP